MAFGLLANLFDANEGRVKQLDRTVAQIDTKSPEMEQLGSEDFAARTARLKEIVQEAGNQPDILNKLVPEAFALVREAAKRVIGEYSFREQLMVGIALHQGGLAEQKTGEGKTHAAVHPLYLNALTGRGAHLVTVNDYLARRDAEWMGPVFHLLGMSVGIINSQGQSFVYNPPEEVASHQFPVSKQYKDQIGNGNFLREVSRREAYMCDVTYGTNNEFGFDYLRDNMVQRPEQMVQTNSLQEMGAHYFAIVDEADSILIDEARTPLIISAPAQESNELYVKFAQLIKRLNSEDYVLDEKSKGAHLTDLGVKKMENWLEVSNLYEDFQLAHHLDQALKAQHLYLNDRDYVVKDGEVIIVDSFTGRLMPGRRYSEGLHQALEAKENVAIQKESKTLATITFQNYFRLYEKLSGMSATIMTESEEFYKIYKLNSVAVPTHRPIQRIDHTDRIYKHQRAKWKAIVDEIAQIYETGQPVLAGTTSVEKNELLSDLLQRRGIVHEVLNAKNHQREAEIIANAGQKGAVTIATNMAGRGTDIKLAEGVRELGGLFVVGTERHEARRIDNQLRGRSGRQGDPGASRFFVALDDDLMRIFGGDRVASVMTRFNLPDDVPIEAGLVSKTIESSQKKVESHNFDIRKHLVEYDDVINRQREIIYERRRRLLHRDKDSQQVNTLRTQLVQKIQKHIHNAATVALSSPDGSVAPVVDEAGSLLPLNAEQKQELATKVQEYLDNQNESFHEYIQQLVEAVYTQREQELGTETMRELERMLMLSTIDYYWMEHIDALDELRYGVRLRAYGQRDPLVEFKNEAFRMFEQLLAAIDDEVVNRLFKVQIVQQVRQTEQDVLQEAQEKHEQVAQFDLRQAPQPTGEAAPVHEPVVKSEHEKIGRNDPCWCGSGKKYKHCGLLNTPEHQEFAAKSA